MEKAFSNLAVRLLDRMRDSLSSPTPPSSDSEFNAWASELFALQFQNNPAYQRICRSRNVSPEIISSWKEVPFVPTEAFKELELTSIPQGERTVVFHSSGTTGQKPSRHFHCAESLAIYEAALLGWFKEQCSGFNAGRDANQFLFLTPSREAAPHSSLVHMFETIRLTSAGANSIFVGRSENNGSWTIDFDHAVDFLRHALERQEVIAILGTAFNFVHLLDELSRRGQKLRLPPGSWLMETGGYKGRSRTMPRAQLHSWMCNMLGLKQPKILCEYGMSELSSQAYSGTAANETQRSGGQEFSPIFRFPPWVGVQLICPESGREVREGEIGLIRLFDLANVYSVAAVQTGDLALKKADGFELIGRSAEAEARGCSLMTAEAF
jgi:hypothetical protein